jgi:hypothetical protein
LGLVGVVGREVGQVESHFGWLADLKYYLLYFLFALMEGYLSHYSAVVN